MPLQKDLTKLLDLLKTKDPKIFVDLQLPEQEKCKYGKDKTKYTEKEYEDAKRAIATYNKFLSDKPETKAATTDADKQSPPSDAKPPPATNDPATKKSKM